MTEYILFVGQCSNFQSRTMLIPYKEFIKAREEDYNILKKHSKKAKFIIDDQEHFVDNLLIIDYKWIGNHGHQVVTEYTSFCGQLESYADGTDMYNEETGKCENVYCDLKDKEWYDTALINLTGGFNHIKNYTKLKKEYNIVDSFLVLESNDGELQYPMFDTVQEMMKEFYNIDLPDKRL